MAQAAWLGFRQKIGQSGASGNVVVQPEGTVGKTRDMRPGWQSGVLLNHQGHGPFQVN